MSKKEISGFLSIQNESPAKDVQSGNISFDHVSLRRTVGFWDNNYSGAPGTDTYIVSIPYKHLDLLDNDGLVGHTEWLNGVSVDYPSVLESINLSIDYAKFRSTDTAATVASSALSRVFGSIGASVSTAGYGINIGDASEGDSLKSINDVPRDYTQIGIVYPHPAHESGVTVTTAIGLSYVTYTASTFWDNIYFFSGCFNLIRLHSGSDAGFYYVQHNDVANNRLYLRNINGTIFSALAAGAVSATACPGRRAFFNEVGVIHLSAAIGVETGGRFNPRKDDPYLRGSFILRVVYDKTGSDESAAAAEQQGSYYLTAKPYTHGEGIIGSTSQDVGAVYNGSLYSRNVNASVGLLPYNYNFMDGGPNAMVLDWAGQRLWFGYTNNSNQSGIGHWRYKTVESFREIASHLGTAVHANYVTPSIVLGAGDIIRGGTIGSNRWVYFAIGHASGGNGGLTIIKPDLTTLQYRIADGVPSSAVAAAVADTSRARLGTSGDVTTTATTANLGSASGAFTNADIGRAIKVTGATNDNGTYKIASVTSGTVVVVQTLAGGAVSFTGGTGGTFEIGDRIYLFFGNNTTGLNTINYMESMAPGTFLTRTFTSTGGLGANCNVQAKHGENQKATVDQATGDVYWLSNDTQQQINKYDVLTNAHTIRTIANIQTPAGGSGTITAATVFTAIHVNSKFNHIWVGTDQGQVRLIKNDFTGANYKRYFGNESTTYVNPTGFLRSSGTLSTGANVNYVRNFYERGDGRMQAALLSSAGTTIDNVVYSQESDTWRWGRSTADVSSALVGTYARNEVHDQYGTSCGLATAPTVASANPQYRMLLQSYELQYQWDNPNSKWIPLEVSQSNLPNKSVSDTFSPGCMTKPMHSGFEDALYGVKIKFTKQGGATASNNEFLGRGGQTRITASDGSTTGGSAIFTGSGFVASDTGRVIRIESGSNIGVYKITYLTATTISLKTMSGAVFSAAGGAEGGLFYSIWDFGAPTSNAGPENVSVLLADGFGKDSSQDITGITYETYHFKSVLSDNDEPRKFTVSNPIAVPGSLDTKVYREGYPVASPQYDVSTSNHRALPGAELANGRQVLDWMIDKVLDGTGAKADMPSTSAISWGGILANAVNGNSVMVDFGKDVQIGHIQFRCTTAGSNAVLNTITSGGLVCNVYKADHSGGTPIATPIGNLRTSGTSNLNYVSGTTTLTLSSGDFLGSTVHGPHADGSMTVGGNVFTSSGSTFLSTDVNKILDITSGPDIRAVRIISVAGGGGSVTTTNLDQTNNSWAGSGGGLSYSVRDGVQEEDMICTPSLAVPTHKLAVERLLSSTSVQVRTAPNASAGPVNYECFRPTWTKVKRLSYSSEALRPEESNNNTWSSVDGRERNNVDDFKSYFDLTDMTSAQNTGRYWKIVQQPRFTTVVSGALFDFSTIEFYDISGNKLAISKYTQTDESRTNLDFLSNHINRFDFIQAASDATSIAGFNGTMNLGGANGDTLTLTGGNAVLGFRIGNTSTDGAISLGGNTITSTQASFPTNAILGRFVRITTGSNQGIYRILNKPTATSVAVSGLSGSAVTWSLGETVAFTIHEGIAAGGAFPDKVRFADGTEFFINTINNTATTLTIAETLQQPRTNQTWEIIRPGYDTASATTEAAKTARLVRPDTTYPVQSGDMAHDSRGAYRFFAEDIGPGYQRADGVISAASNVFTGSDFSKDDEGRLLYIISGTGTQANNGIYEIQTVSSPTSIIVKNHYTGGVVTFAIDAGPVTYQIQGDRRFRISKLVVSLRA